MKITLQLSDEDLKAAVLLWAKSLKHLPEGATAVEVDLGTKSVSTGYGMDEVDKYVPAISIEYAKP